VTIVEPAGYEQENPTTTAKVEEDKGEEQQVEEAALSTNRRRLLDFRGKRLKEEEKSEGEKEKEEKEEQEEQEEQEEEHDHVEEENGQQEVLPLPDAKDVITIDPYLHITWNDLEVESLELANELKIMCVEYGYPLDPNQAPQSFQSHQFTA
jgi:hypothetical protein